MKLKRPRLRKPARPTCRSLGPTALDPATVEALCTPRIRRAPGQPDVVEHGIGEFCYIRVSNHDGSSEVFRFETEAEATLAMRIAMQADAIKNGLACLD